MLIDKYLSAYDFNELHSIKVNASAEGIYEKMLSCDVSRSFLVRFLFRLRGMPKHLCTIEHLNDSTIIQVNNSDIKEVEYQFKRSK